MKEENSAARGMIALSFAGIMSKVLSIFYSPFLIAILGDSGFGIYSKTLDVFLFIYAIACTGTQPAVAKVVTELIALDNPKGANRALKLSRNLYMLLGGILGSIMIVFAFPIAGLTGNTDIAYGLMFLGPCVFVTAILSVYRGYMQGRNNVTSIAVSQIIEQLFNVIISLIGAFVLMKVSLPLGSAGGQIGTSVGALIGCLYLVYCYEKKGYSNDAHRYGFSNKKISDKKIIRKVVMYSIPITMSAALQNLGGLIDMGNVSRGLMEAGFTQLEGDILYGLYSKYKTLYGVPLTIITAIATTMLPSITRSFVLNDRREVKKKIGSVFKLIFIIAIPSAVGLAVLSPEIYITLYGNTNGTTIMMVGSFILIIMAVTQIQSMILQSINKLYFVLKTFTVGIIFKIVLNYIFVRITDINIYGVLIGNCFWHLIPAILNNIKISKEMKMKISIKRLTIVPIIASTAMGIALMLCKFATNPILNMLGGGRISGAIVTIPLVVVGVFVYAYILIALGGITKKDLKMISPKIIRIIPNFMKKYLV